MTTTHRDKGWLDRLTGRYDKVGGMEIAVGFPQGKCQAYPDGTAVEDVAARNCFGIGVPERNFMALAQSDIEKKTQPIMKALVAELNSGDGRGVDALRKAAGEAGVSAIKKAITDLDTPPNAPATIAAKGSDNPLIDTSHMRNSVTYVVREARQ